MRLIRFGALVVRALLCCFYFVNAACSPSRSVGMQFSGVDEQLEIAIAADDPAGIKVALSKGANVNARGQKGVTPLAYAVGIRKKAAVAELVRSRANPNLKDDEGDSSVGLAVNVYSTDPSFLDLVLEGGGDPNATRPDGDPVIVRFINDRNLAAITYLHSRGASIDSTVNGQPMIVDAAYGTDWDVVWHLIHLGAKLDTAQVRSGLTESFNVPAATSPDSPIYPYKVQVWRKLRGLGMSPRPPAGMLEQ